MLTATDSLAHIEAPRAALRDGLRCALAGMASALRQTGPRKCPWSCSTATDLRRGNAFCAAALRHGVYLHPRHNMFLCAAHTEENIAEALEAAEHGFAAAAEAAAVAA